jgi:anthranilate phosphoribosyltransferase
MRHVVGVRRKLGVKTLFNLLGPLCNPAAATHQLLGVSTAKDQQQIAAAIGQLGTTRSFVVHASDGQDEVSLDGTTEAIDVSGEQCQNHCWSPRDFGLLPVGRESLAAAGPAESAAIIRRVLDGQPGPCRDTVLAGAAAALLLVGKSDSLREAAGRAAKAIDDGDAKDKLEALRQFN